MRMQRIYQEKDIMDVWFDSGSSHAAVLENNGRLDMACGHVSGRKRPAQGWFQSSLLTAVATKGQAPYKTVLTHGYVVDVEGRKMSKSLGNGIDPEDVIKEYGADILRLWLHLRTTGRTSGYPRIYLKQLSEVYRKIRNTCRYILGNIYDLTRIKIW